MPGVNILISEFSPNDSRDFVGGVSDSVANTIVKINNRISLSSPSRAVVISHSFKSYTISMGNNQKMADL
jgi:hypothetical protein